MENVLGLVNSLEMNELHRAVQENRLEAVKFLIANDADIANTIDGGQTPLHLSCSLNLPHITRELLKNKPRDELRECINAKTVDTGTTALHLAVANNSLESVRLLFACGAYYDIRNSDNQPPETLAKDESISELIASVEEMFRSIPSGHSQTILDRLNSCPPDNLAALMHARDSQNYTALQVAISRFDLNTVGTIIDVSMQKLKQNPWQAGVEIDELVQHSRAVRLRSNRLDEYCRKSADLVIEPQLKEALSLLQETHDFLEAYKRQRDPSFTDQPLLIIIEECLEFFGSSTTSTFVENNNVALIVWKDVRLATSMLKLCIIAPMQLLMQQIYTLELLDAAKRNSYNLVKQCLAGHPDLNKEDADNHTALRYAFIHKNYEMVKTLLRFGADPTIESGRLEEPLLHCALRCMRESRQPIDAEILQLLFDRLSDEKLRHFLDAKTRGMDSESALHWAIGNYDLPLVLFLMSKGADYRAKSGNGRMPISSSSNSKIYQLLCFTDQLFDYAGNGKVEKLIDELSEVGVPSLLAVTGARNKKGRTLEQVADVEAAVKIRELLSDERAARCKRDAIEFFEFGMRNAEPIYFDARVVPINYYAHDRMYG